jgi:uncharacterized protein YndB with AHSA1/START domain
MAEKYVSAERVIHASPEKIFDLLARPRGHLEIDGSGTVKDVQDDTPERLELGAKFGMKMKIGLPYPITNTVIEFEENRRIAWWHPAHNIWRYELTPQADGSTLVKETFDYSQGRGGFLLGTIGFVKKNEKGIQATLARLAQVVEAPTPGS